MARKFYRLLWGMKEHPETFAERGYQPLKANEVYPGGYRSLVDHQLLYAGDVFEVDENLILRDPAMGGWVERKADGKVALEIAEPAESETKESWTVRDEPSRIAGINISTQELARLEREESEDSHVLQPVASVAAGAPASVKPAGRAAAR